MRHAAIYAVIFTLVSLGAGTANAEISWESKLRDAHIKAKEQGKLMLLHFYTDNCVYCDRLEQGAYRSASVAKAINDNFVPVKVHGGKNPKLAGMFKVSKYPTDVIVTTDGKALSHSVSPQQPDRYIAMLSGAQVTYHKSQTMIAGKTDAPRQTALANTSAAPTASAPSYAALPATNNLQSADTSTGRTKPQVDAVAQTAPSASQPALGMTLPTAARSTAPANSAGLQLPADPSLTAAASQMTLPAPTTDDSVTQGATATPDAAPQVNATLASSKIEPVATSGLVDVAAELPAAPSKATSTQEAELAIQGYCAVSVVNKGEWVEGKPELGVIHLGKLYLFSNQESMDLFLADPEPYTPMMNEIDVVRFFEEKKIVPGKREWGVIDPIHNRMFFFADEASMVHFENSFDRYLDASIEVMSRAIKEANPGT